MWPNFNVHEFNQCFIDPLLHKINSENKQCILMGDFNIDLLKCETHEDSNAFLNSLFSSFFTPYVLQPTRLTSFFTPYVLQPTRLTSFFTP